MEGGRLKRQRLGGGQRCEATGECQNHPHTTAAPTRWYDGDGDGAGAGTSHTCVARARRRTGRHVGRWSLLTKQQACWAVVAVVLWMCCAHATETQVMQKRQGQAEKYNYAQVMYLSLLFYEAQRSGKLPPTNRIPWRRDSGLLDGHDVGVDLSGGWYDAGDHVKFSFPMAWSVTTLCWGLLEYWDAWERAGELEQALDAVAWPLDFFIRAHPDPDTFYVQVGDGMADHAYWGPADLMNMKRPSFAVTRNRPGSEPPAEAAAALAAASIVFKERDSVYSNRLLNTAETLFDLAFTHQASCNISDPFYTSYSGYKDELAWASLWLHKATGQNDYLHKAQAIYPSCCTSTPQSFDWDNKAAGVMLLLYKTTGHQQYANAFMSFMQGWLTMPTTPKGLSWLRQWSPNRYAANTAFLALVAADYGIEPSQYREYAKAQIHYMLGDAGGGVNPKTGQPHFSFVVGYGDSSPVNYHHRGASCDEEACEACDNRPRRHVLYGALVGGPAKDDSYEDTCHNYEMNEVACDYNAGFTSAVAGLKHLSMTGQLSE